VSIEQVFSRFGDKAMTRNYWARKRLKRREAGRRGAEAKARKRMAEGEAMTDVGGLVTDGCLGKHSIRLLAWPGEARSVAVVCDGQHRRPRSLRGVQRCIAMMLSRHLTPEAKP
jgi:hypothetical protein